MNYGMNPMMNQMNPIMYPIIALNQNFNQQNEFMISDMNLFGVFDIARGLASRNVVNSNIAQFWMLRTQQMNWQIQMMYMRMTQMQMMLNIFQASAPAIAPAAGVSAGGIPSVVAPHAEHVIHIAPVYHRSANNLAASQRIQFNRPRLD